MLDIGKTVNMTELVSTIIQDVISMMLFDKIISAKIPLIKNGKIYEELPLCDHIHYTVINLIGSYYNSILLVLPELKYFLKP